MRLKKVTRFQMFGTLEAATFWFDAFNIVLVVGAVVVAIATWGSIQTAAVKEQFSDERIAANEAATKRAVAESDAAKEGTAKANERIAELAVEGDQLRKITAEATARALEAKLALEKFKEPRSLTLNKISEIADKLKAHAGTRFDTSVVPGDPEAMMFLASVAATLESAGWIWVEWNPPSGPLAMTYSFPGKPNIGQGGFFGVSLMFHPDYKTNFTAAAEELGRTLLSENFETSLEIIERADIPNKDTLHIVIGKKR